MSITEQHGHFIGTSQDPSWRRGVHEGALLALKLAERHDAAALAAWIARLGEWRFDGEAGELPPDINGGGA
ncbi:MAG: hypothetical protein WD009_00990 [Phycisphaeraceae bacterium]